jgi:tetratricopeptide (TPR) repeat protein
MSAAANSKGKRSSESPTRVRPIARYWPWGLAGLVIVMAIIVIRQLFQINVSPPPVVNTSGFDPAISAAIGQARETALRSPRSQEAIGRLGMVLLAHEVRLEACDCFLQASILAPRDPRWPYYLGVAQLIDNPIGAATNIAKAAQLIGTPTEMGRQQDGGRPSHLATLAIRLRLADTLLNLGRLDESESHFRQLWAVHSNSAPVALGLGKIANARDNAPEAAPLLARALHDPATRKAAHRLLITVYQRLGRSNEVGQLAPVLATLPNDVSFADPFMEEIEKLKTGENAWIDQADEWIKAGRFVEAARLLETTLERYPNSDRAMFFLGRARLRLGNSAGAEAILTRALELSPGKIEARMQLGVIHLTRGRNREAQKCFRAAIEAKPNLPEAWLNLGMSLGGENRVESAAAFQEAIRLKPNLMEAYLGLAVVLRAEGQKQAAANELRRALALHPEEPMRRKLLDQLKLAE